ncbi:hypothetical protein H4Q26_016308 [Puccinia striiformis f. sp. tritici PST-130]|nr:hypothetical protein H4Q26_016308 [Puccinia striiformis f. sp. tritici PST-130]
MSKLVNHCSYRWVAWSTSLTNIQASTWSHRHRQSHKKIIKSIRSHKNKSTSDTSTLILLMNKQIRGLITGSKMHQGPEINITWLSAPMPLPNSTQSNSKLPTQLSSSVLPFAMNSSFNFQSTTVPNPLMIWMQMLSPNTGNATVPIK